MWSGCWFECQRGSCCSADNTGELTLQQFVAAQLRGATRSDCRPIEALNLGCARMLLGPRPGVAGTTWGGILSFAYALRPSPSPPCMAMRCRTPVLLSPRADNRRQLRARRHIASSSRTWCVPHLVKRSVSSAPGAPGMQSQQRRGTDGATDVSPESVARCHTEHHASFTASDSPVLMVRSAVSS